MSREVSNSNSQVVDSLDDLLLVFSKGSRKQEEYKIGMEFERFLVDAQTLRAVPFEGDRGIERFLRELASSDLPGHTWEKVLDQGKLISLKWGETAITLEPGGQVEISCSAHDNMQNLYRELELLDSMMHKIADKIGTKLIARGIQPMETIETSPWMPKSRYRWMKEYYEKRNQSAFEMMLLTASIQVNFDYSSEQDAARKVFVSSFLSPILGAVFANSSIEQGKPNGFVTRRIPIWRKTDPDRCGTPDFFVDGTFSFEKYRDYALDIPMYFAFRNGEYVDVQNITFREFLSSQGGKWGPVTLGDWEFHLTTLFPEVRLKNHLEFRTADSNPVELVVALATMWKGLFYNQVAIAKWFEFFQKYNKDDLTTSLTDVSKNGLSAKFGSHSVLSLAKDLMNDAVQYLSSRSGMKTEIVFLQPIQQILDEGISPGEKLIDMFRKNQNHKNL